MSVCFEEINNFVFNSVPFALLINHLGRFPSHFKHSISIITSKLRLKMKSNNTKHSTIPRESTLGSSKMMHWNDCSNVASETNKPKKKKKKQKYFKRPWSCKILRLLHTKITKQHIGSCQYLSRRPHSHLTRRCTHAWMRSAEIGLFVPLDIDLGLKKQSVARSINAD